MSTTDRAARPLCFVLMPFGTKTDGVGHPIDFDALYADVYKPAVEAAGMDSLRADEERDGGIIHKPMFERLVLCPFALADLTLANANVFYELGVRHAVRPSSTVLTFEAGGQRLPFDVAPLRSLPYEVTAKGAPVDPGDLRRTITDLLNNARENVPDSPLYQLLEGFTPPDIARLKTDVFRDQVRYSEEMKRRLRDARSTGLEAVRSLHEELRPIQDKEAGVIIDLYLSYRDVAGYEEMIELVAEMAPHLRNSVLVQEQLGFALNRFGRRADARRVLEAVIEAHGPSSETYGLLGRVFKDQWQDATDDGRVAEATAHLRRAIEAYRSGFEADWRDAFPGVNAVTLLDAQGPDQPEFHRLLPVVRYAVQRRIESGAGDYWDLASMVELCAHADDEPGAGEYAGECMALGAPDWQVQTTIRNLNILRTSRVVRGRSTDAIDAALSVLSRNL